VLQRATELIRRRSFAASEQAQRLSGWAKGTRAERVHGELMRCLGRFDYRAAAESLRQLEAELDLEIEI